MLCLQEIMIDPVVASDGVTYEREDIQGWMNTSNVSPETHKAFASKDLTPNRLVLQLIHEFNNYLSRGE